MNLIGKTFIIRQFHGKDSFKMGEDGKLQWGFSVYCENCLQYLNDNGSTINVDDFDNVALICASCERIHPVQVCN